MKKNIMLSGLPRSGSSVLTSLLNQHPEIYASTTSPVADLISIIADSWPNISQALADPDPSQYGNIIKGVFNGAYNHIDKSVVVDKNRLWPRFGKLMHQAFVDKPKIICTVREIPAILASYILLINRNKDKITYIDQDLIDSKLPINNKNRCKILWEKYINHPYTSLRLGYSSSDVDLLILDYTDIVENGQLTMNKICEFIGIPSYDIKLSGLQAMKENDKYHGGLEGLHDIRTTLVKTSPPPEQVIGHELTQYYRDMKLDFWNK